MTGSLSSFDRSDKGRAKMFHPQDTKSSKKTLIAAGVVAAEALVLLLLLLLLVLLLLSPWRRGGGGAASGFKPLLSARRTSMRVQSGGVAPTTFGWCTDAKWAERAEE